MIFYTQQESNITFFFTYIWIFLTLYFFIQKAYKIILTCHKWKSGRARTVDIINQKKCEKKKGGNKRNQLIVREREIRLSSSDDPTPPNPSLPLFWIPWSSNRIADSPNYLERPETERDHTVPDCTWLIQIPPPAPPPVSGNFRWDHSWIPAYRSSRRIEPLR